MKLTIIARGRDDFGVIVNSEELHRTKQSIFKVNVTDADLHELTQSRIDKDHLNEFAFTFLLELEPGDAIKSSFNMKTISHYLPEFPAAVKSWLMKIPSSHFG